MSELTFANTSYHLHGQPLVQDCALQMKSGELVVLLGANGAGKTSLLRLGLGLLTPSAGSVLLNGQNLGRYSPIQRAQLLGYLPQSRSLAWPNRVHDVVALGRFAHGATLGRLGQADRRFVNQAMQDCQVLELANRNADSLSGGELARVHCARAFASNTPLLLADEPTAALDPLHQHQIMTLLRRYAQLGGGALVVLHDVALAARYADRLVWLKSSKIIAQGPTNDTLTPQRISEIYGVNARVVPTPSTEQTQIGYDVYIDGPS